MDLEDEAGVVVETPQFGEIEADPPAEAEALQHRPDLAQPGEGLAGALRQRRAAGRLDHFRPAGAIQRPDQRPGGGPERRVQPGPVPPPESAERRGAALVRSGAPASASSRRPSGKPAWPRVKRKPDTPRRSSTSRATSRISRSAAAPPAKCLHPDFPERRRTEPAPRPAHRFAAVEQAVRLRRQPGRRRAGREGGEVGAQREQVPSLGEPVTRPLRPAPPAAGEDLGVVEERQQDFLVPPAGEHFGRRLLHEAAPPRRSARVRDRPGRRAEERIGAIHRRFNCRCSATPGCAPPPDRRSRGRSRGRPGRPPAGGLPPRTAAGAR